MGAFPLARKSAFPVSSVAVPSPTVQSGNVMYFVMECESSPFGSSLPLLFHNPGYAVKLTNALLSVVVYFIIIIKNYCPGSTNPKMTLVYHRTLADRSIVTEMYFSKNVFQKKCLAFG